MAQPRGYRGGPLDSMSSWGSWRHKDDVDGRSWGETSRTGGLHGESLSLSSYDKKCALSLRQH